MHKRGGNIHSGITADLLVGHLEMGKCIQSSVRGELSLSLEGFNGFSCLKFAKGV